MRMKYGSMALILIQVFVISAMVGALSPTVSAARGDVNTTTSNPDFAEIPTREEVGFDWFDSADNCGPEFVPGEILVKFKTDITMGLTKGIVTTGITSIDKLNKRFEANGMRKVLSNVYKLKLPKDVDVLSVAREYEADPNVECAQPNYMYHYSVVPNDTEYWKQWAHEVTQAELAWDTTTGDPSVVIAILDSGVQWNHTDLAASIWNNTDEEIGDANGDGYPGVAGVDDDGDGLVDEDSNGKQPGEEGYTNDLKDDDDENGYVDDIRGWDFYDDDNDPVDTYGHGTHCAGIAAAVGNNGEGVAGASWLSSIMAVRVGGDSGPTTDGIIKGIRYAANNGANIISMSFSISTDDPTVHNEVATAYNSNVLLVAAAGNSAVYYPRYPAAWSEVVAVSATDSADDPASFTNFGDWIEVAAPGVHTYSTLLNNTYGYASGTSMSCPYVAGVAALIKSRFPSMTNVEVRGQLGNTTDDIGEPGFDVYYGYGRVNARWAVDHGSSEHDLRAWGMEAPRVLKPGNTTTINGTVLNFGKKNESDIYVQLLVNGTVVDNATISFLASYSGAVVNFSWTPTAEGRYNVTLYVARDDEFMNNNALSVLVVVRVEEVVRVPEDFSTIHRAISAANPGYTVQVSSGTYYEYVDIDKPLTLTATDPDTTIIDGGGSGDPIIHVHAPAYIANVSVSHFIIRNGEMGIFTDASSPRRYFSFSSNAISGNKYGILLTATFDASIESNFLTNNTYGIRMVKSYGGNTLKDNVISNNTIAGIYAFDGGIDIIGNNISMNGDGIYLHNSFFFIYHNNFIDNTRQLVIYYYSFPELDDGYPSGGNYWSDYTGEDLYSGPYQNETGSDSIGDTPYVIDENNQDNYPLMHPWGSIRNIDTGLIYLTIQKAINAPETLGGHTIQVVAGTYYESVTVDKSLKLIGENRDTTIIDGNGANDVICVTANSVLIREFTVQNGYSNGILLAAYTGHNTIFNNTIQNNLVGIYVAHESHCNGIRYNVVSSNSCGIRLDQDASNNTLYHNNISSNTEYGIDITDCTFENHICHNYISGNERGIYLSYASKQIIRSNEISSNQFGIYVFHSDDNVVYRNNFIGNSIQVKSIASVNGWDDGFASEGNYWSDYTGQDQNGDGIGDTPYVINKDNQDNYPLIRPWGSIRNIDTDRIYLTIQKAIDATETSDGHTIEVKAGTYYEHVVVNKSLTLTGEDSSNTIIDGGGTGYVVTVQANDVRISQFTIQNGEYGIYADHWNNTSVSGNMVLDNNYGILVYNNSNNTIIGNTAPSILFYNNSNNTIIGNTVLYNKRYFAGILLHLSNYNTVHDNTVLNFDTFMGIFLLNSTSNTVTDNTISNNTYGIDLLESCDNTIHHNNFINNTIEAHTSESYNNVWWCPANHVGNYWSDYTGPDNETYYGIGDTPYVIDQNNQDDYPLMWKWFPGDIDGDGDVDDDDYNLWLEAVGTHDGDPDYNPIADLNYDGTIDLDDFLIWRENKGK